MISDSSYISKYNHSSSISIGLIIGIISGGIVFIDAIIVIIIYFIKKKKSKEGENSTIKEIIITDNNNLLIQDVMYDYEPQSKRSDKKIVIVFMTMTQKQTKILIDPNKSVKNLIKFYLKVIKSLSYFVIQILHIL